jgi:hypothetical protein
LRRRIEIERLNDIYAAKVPGGLWRVRYFKDGQPEEYAVILRPDGSLHSLHHTLGEDTPGASLSKEDAIARAEKFVREEKKIDLGGWSLVGANSDKRPHRTDHMLTWQQNEALDGGTGSEMDSANHAHARMDLDVLGDEPANYRTYVKIPDEWRRKQEEQTLLRTIYSFAVPILLFGGLGVTAIVLFFMNLRSGAIRAIPWKRLALWTLWGLVAYALIVGCGDGLQQLMNRYDTAIPFKTMLGGVVIGLLIFAVFYVGGFAVLFGIASYFSNRAFGEERLPVGGRLPAVYYRDALWIGICGTATIAGIRRLIESLSLHWPTIHRSFPTELGQNFDALLPAAALFGGALRSGLFAAGLIGLLAAFVAAVVKPRWLRFLLFLLGALYLTGNGWGDGRDFAKQFIAEAIMLAVIAIGVRRIVRFNVLGYFLVAACLSLLGGATQLLAQPDPFYRTNGYGLLLMIGLLLAWPLFMWKTRPSEGDSGQLATPQEVSAAGNL